MYFCDSDVQVQTESKSSKIQESAGKSASKMEVLAKKGGAGKKRSAGKGVVPVESGLPALWPAPLSASSPANTFLGIGTGPWDRKSICCPRHFRLHQHSHNRDYGPAGDFCKINSESVIFCN